RVAVFAARDGGTLLLHESTVRDLAVDEEVEIDMGESSDVQVASEKEKATIDTARAGTLPLIPGAMQRRSAPLDAVNRVDVSNARAADIHFELRLRLPEGG